MAEFTSESDLQHYDFSCFEEIKSSIGSGTYGDVDLYYFPELERFVVGKSFVVGGDEKIIKKRFAEAKREASILKRIKHDNIVRILGTSVKECRYFVIILEYASCGNLESFLSLYADDSLSWKIRARFFLELANGLNYLHYNDSKRSYIHGDLKPQNVLLVEGLTIKLADFGATTIAKIAGATSLTAISSTENCQYTLFYTAPEYLSDLRKKRTCSMDVYSYGMVGYEIITKKQVFNGSAASPDLLIYLISNRGQKPDTSILENMVDTLKEDSSDLSIFNELKAIVYQCWQTEASHRPKISNVKENLDKLASNEQIYDKATDAYARSLIKEKKVKDELPVNTVASKIRRMINRTQHFINKHLVLSIVFVAIVAPIIGNILYTSIPQKIDPPAIFLEINESSVMKYAIDSRNVKTLLHLSLPASYVKRRYTPHATKVQDMLYVTNINTTVTMKVNLSEPVLSWKRVEMRQEFVDKRYLAFRDSVLAIGAQDNVKYGQPIFGQCTQVNAGIGIGSKKGYLYNTTRDTLYDLPDMSEPRLEQTLVLFRGTICAVGGSLEPTVECFNGTSKSWNKLPDMITARRNAAAVELNDELYVIAGNKAMTSLDAAQDEFFDKSDVNAIDLVEKFNPETKKWTKVASLKHRRAHHSAGVFNEKIYVIGGSSDIVEAYDPSENIWKSVNSVPKDQGFTRFIAIE